MSRANNLAARVSHFFHREIWNPAHLNERSWRGRAYAVLRIVSITLVGLDENRATSRAAALSFSSLLGLGPLVAIAVLVAGFAVDSRDPHLVANKLNELITYVAPQIAQFQQSSPPAAPNDGDEPPAPAGTTTQAGQTVPSAVVAVNPGIVDLINNFISGARSSTAGVVSAISLIMIVLLLFSSVEGVFNDIWGVRRGRSWLTRIVFYWTILTLGAVLFFGAIGAQLWATFQSFFSDHLPIKNALVTDVFDVLFRFIPPVMMVAVLTLFYKYIPNTHVYWRSAFVGACVVAVLLVLNNLLAFSYSRRVILTRNLYGGVGLLAVLMFGLYIFWLFVLVGGQLSYAVQNVHFRNSQAAWTNLTASTRERLTLAVLLSIARRFQACLPPATASELSLTIKVPTQILNECLNRLVDLRLVSPIPPPPHSVSSDFLYQPARPLNRICLRDFVHLFENYGESPAGSSINRLDPILQHYREAMDEATKQDFFTKTLDQLLSEHAPQAAEAAG
jgi:membrane protein